MRLYHGSNTVIEKIDLSRSKPHKDFGRGFYLTEDREQANVLARQRVMMSGGHAVINEYEFDESVLSSGLLKIKTFDGYTEEWAEFILRNRDKGREGNAHDYDIVIGPIADDKVGLQVRLCLDNLIDIPTLVNRLRYNHVTIQYFFGTEVAIKTLKKV